jgi:anti-sigma-K factor RskA
VTAACETCRELIGGYVLDALEPVELELVRRHLETCASCAREHAELAAIPALLDVADSADAVPPRPPARLEEAVLDRFARESRGAGSPVRARTARRNGLRRWLAPAAAGLAFVLVALVAVLVLTGNGDDSSPARPVAAGDAGSAGSSRPIGYTVAMAGTGPLPGAAADVRLYPGETGTGIHLSASGLEPQRYEYELWCVRDDGWKVSAGTFRADANGNADVRLTTAARPSEYDSLAIQAHPAAGGANAGGPRVLAGRLRS